MASNDEAAHAANETSLRISCLPIHFLPQPHNLLSPFGAIILTQPAIERSSGAVAFDG